MKPFLALTVSALVLSVGCQTTQPAGPPPEQKPYPTPIAPSLPHQREVFREHLEGLLDQAIEAVEERNPEGLASCETVVLRELTRLPDSLARDNELLVFSAEILDGFDRLREDLSFGGGEPTEGPPDPLPVSPEKVVDAREMASAGQFDLPVVVNPEVTSLLEFYTGPFRDNFAAALDRAAGYLPAIREELVRRGLPQDLAFLPLVESAFHPRARSRAGAQGLWQFMAGTARLYDLRVDSLVDERNDPFLSTTAAAAHLADLFEAFGDWELALAAYNSGSGRVRRAIRRAGGERDFWRLRRFLPRETRNYVPAIWAVLVAIKNPEAHGLPAITEHTNCLARIPIQGALDLAVLAERSGLPEKSLSAWNPALTFGLTPVRGEYQLAVECGLEDEVAGILAGIPEQERVRRFIHRVAHGDTLSAVARRYDSSIQAIVAANGLRNPNRLSIGQTLVVPRDPRGGLTGSPPPRASAAGADPRRRYVVRQGDTLYSIARRHRTTVAQIMRRNGLSNSRIRSGQVLVLAP